MKGHDHTKNSSNNWVDISCSVKYNAFPNFYVEIKVRTVSMIFLLCSTMHATSSLDDGSLGNEFCNRSVQQIWEFKLNRIHRVPISYFVSRTFVWPFFTSFFSKYLHLFQVFLLWARITWDKKALCPYRNISLRPDAR